MSKQFKTVETLTDKEEITNRFNYIFGKNKDLSADEMLKELSEVLPELYREHKRIADVEYAEKRRENIKGELSYISDRWTTEERIAFIITAINERNI